MDFQRIELCFSCSWSLRRTSSTIVASCCWAVVALSLSKLLFSKSRLLDDSAPSSSVDSKGLSDKTCEVLVRINKQSPDIAGGVHVGKEDLDVGAGDQGIMFGYASDETEDCMPLTHSMATRLGKKLTDVRKSGLLWWLSPDGKTQVTIEYLQRADGSVEPGKNPYC